MGERAGRGWSNDRGIALPMAMFALLVIMALTLAFVRLGLSEPLIANNQLATAQARLLAESGLERAIWALSSGDATTYDGESFYTVSPVGGFTLRITNGMVSNERTVVAIGWSPTDDPSAARAKGVRKVQATLETDAPKNLDPPCAFCVGGDITLHNKAYIDARTSQCPGGAPPVAGTMSLGVTGQHCGSVDVWGPGNNVSNEAADTAQGAGQDFSFKWSSEELARLKQIAIANGTYYQGVVRFDGNNPPPAGIIFVDTVSGNEFTASTPDADAADVELTGNYDWRGWLVVAGSVSINTQGVLNGLVYALDNVNYRAQQGTLNGAIIAENRKPVTGKKSEIGFGQGRVNYNCAYVRDPGTGLPTAWRLKAGSFNELAGR